MRGCVHTSCRACPHGQGVWYAIVVQRVFGHRVQRGRTLGAEREKEYRCREVRLTLSLIPHSCMKFPRRTFNPLEDKIEILRKLEEVAEELEGDMAANGWAGRTVTLKFKRSTFEGKQCSGSLPGLPHPTRHLC